MFCSPSGLNAHARKRMCCSYKETSDELCHSLALLARRICTQFIDPTILAPFLACRLIALNKNPGVRPIGVCEVARRIVSKAINSVRNQRGPSRCCRIAPALWWSDSRYRSSRAFGQKFIFNNESPSTGRRQQCV